MEKIIAVANQKGGVGKTTAVVNLAYALGQRKKRVLVIDADPQSSLTVYYGYDPRGLEEEARTLYHALIKDKDLKSILLDATASIPALAPSSIRLANAEPELVSLWDSVGVLREKLEDIKNHYDFILLDCPPSLTLLTVNALASAHLVLIPVKTDYLSIMGIPLLLDTVDKLRRRINPNLEVLGVLPTMFNARNTHDRECLVELRKSLEPRIEVFEPIHRSTAFDKSPVEGKSTLELLPNTPGVQVYNSLAARFVLL
jgi:chromosome partitioning protein